MPNRTIPEFWNYDLTLNNLTMRAELLFRKIHHVMDDSHRFEIGPSPEKPLLLHSKLYALRPSQRLTDTTRQLHELRMAGVILVRDSERGWYGEIIERLRYRASDFEKGAPRYGPRTMELPSQKELKLGIVCEVPAVPKSIVVPMTKSRPYDYEYVIGNDTIQSENRNRGDAAEKESKPRFARSIEDLNASALGRRLVMFLGMKQAMIEADRSGAEWLRILRDESVALEELLDQGERQTTTISKGLERAQFLTGRLGKWRAA